MTKREWRLIVGLAALGCVICYRAWAVDVVAPCWRGQAGSTFQQWDFSSSNSPTPPELSTNTYGTSQANIMPGAFSSGWRHQVPGLGMTQSGYWDLGRNGTITLTVPNHPGAPTPAYKYLWIQIVQWQDGGIFSQLASMDIAGATHLSRQQITATNTGFGSWLVDASVWRLDSCPISETIIVTGAFNGSIIDEIIVETRCFDLCPTDILLSADPGQCSKSNVTWTLPPVDGCSVTNANCTPPSGSTFAVGTNLVTCTIVDTLFKTNTCVFHVIVRSTEPPQITCPSDITIQCLADGPPCATNLAGFLVAGGTVNKTNLTYSCMDGPLVGGTCGGTITRTHTVFDECMNSASCQQIITVRDTIPPMIACGANRTVSCAISWTFDSPAATDNCQGTNVSIRIISTVTNRIGFCGQGFSATRTWEVDDGCTSNRCSQTLTVVDTTPPSFTCPDNITTCVASVQFPLPTATDDCDPSPHEVCTRSDGQSLTDPYPLGSTTVTCVATDGCNTNSCSFTVIVQAFSAVGPTNSAVRMDMPIELCTVAQGGGPFTYQWLRNDSALPGSTNACLIVADSGQYCVRVSGACGVVTNCAAVLLADIHIITLADPPEGGTASGGNVFTNGQPVSLLATPNSGFLFVHWSENNSMVSTSMVYAFTAQSNRTLVAHFIRSPGEYRGYWKLDDGHGTTALDSSGHGNHGRLTNGPVFTALGRVGGALNFDGVNDWVRVPDADSLEFVNRSFSVALWLKSTKSGAQMLVEKQHSGFYGPFLFALNRDNLTSTRGAFSVWTGKIWIDSNFRGLTDGLWHHLAVTFDGSSFRLYRDGILDKAQMAAAAYVATSFPLNFGRFATANQGWFFRGMMDEIVCASRALSTQEIAALAGAVSPVVLTVTSATQNSGVQVTVNPSDMNGLGNGTTLFTRFYASNTVVTLTASPSEGGNNFLKWQRNGTDLTTNLTAMVTMDMNYTLTAVYPAPPPPPARTLTVASVNPNSSVGVTVSPNDTNGLGNGTTLFTRIYTNNTVVTLTAAASAGGNTFQKWQRDGADYTNSPTAQLVVDTTRTMTAIYQTPTPTTRTLTVTSSHPNSGVNITVSPNATNGLGNGSTLFTRAYSNNTVVTLTAPLSAGGNNFQKWQRDGADWSTNLMTTVTMDANRTMSALYVATNNTNHAGLVGYWKFDDGNGLSALDSSGLGHHGSLVNGPFFTNGMCNGALFFDGVNDFVRVADADLLDFNGKHFTVALKVKTTKTGPQMLVEKQHSGFSGVFLFALNRDNLVSTRGGFGVWAGGMWIDSNWHGVTNGAWHHLAVTFDGTHFRLYRDGILDKTQSAGAAYVNSTLPLNFGRFVTANQGWPFSGLMDEILRYNRALTDAEVAELTNCPSLLTLASPSAGSVSVGAGPRLPIVRIVAGNPVRLQVTGQPGRTYWIEASTTLQGWTTIGSLEASSSGTFEFTDHNAPEFPTQFYRVVEP